MGAPKPNVLVANAAQVNLAGANLKPVITQKGVDMRIGLGLAALTLKKELGIIVLVSGDSGFVRAMEFDR